jgi:regulator of RNase E activity RraA
MIKNLFSVLAICTLFMPLANAQQIQSDPAYVTKITSDWKGERMPDGRPKVSDELLERLKNISIEEAWGYLRNKGYHNQFEAGWQLIGEQKPLVGRVLTTQYMPERPDLNDKIKEKGQTEGRVGSPNSWPIDMLTKGDIYVADGFGKIIDGTLIGDNLGNSIYAKSGTGVVFDGGVRDLDGLEAIEGFTGYVRGVDPSYIQGMMMTCINCPIRIGRVTVMPGDLLLGKKEGVIFIPAFLVAELVQNGEFTALRDGFGIEKLKEGKYTPGEIDRKWSDAIKNDFLQWIKSHPEKLQMSPKEFEDFMKERNW